jgi:hypothetical protein
MRCLKLCRLRVAVDVSIVLLVTADYCDSHVTDAFHACWITRVLFVMSFRRLRANFLTLSICFACFVRCAMIFAAIS